MKDNESPYSLNDLQAAMDKRSYFKGEHSKAQKALTVAEARVRELQNDEAVAKAALDKIEADVINITKKLG